MSFLDHLAKQDILSDDDIAAIREKAEQSNTALDELLASRGLSQKQIRNAKAEYYDLTARAVGRSEIPKEVLDHIPEESASYYQIVPLEVSNQTLEVGIVNPNNIEARDALNFITQKNNLGYSLNVITKQDLDKVLKQYGGLSGEVGEVLSEIDTEDQRQKKESDTETRGAEDKTGELTDKEEIRKDDTADQDQGMIVEDAPVTKIVATILRYATEGNASDIHIERMRDNVRVRFRVDGVLNTSLMLPTKVHQAVVARIKILASMRLDEKRKPQDGRFSAKIEGKRIDFRVSTFPAYYGEKIVMRLLDQEAGLKKLEELGIREPNQKMIEEALGAAHGMILISGPTGSGKTTTLYSMLDRVDKEKKNVLSLEDPVEYNLEGVSQSQVRPDIGYTFANGLRTTLRQDPDVILVGEIRDKETAELAIHAALTGHLVLSTIHTNSAIGIIPRLIDMGIDPYLIAPTLILGIAQRLVPQLCEGAGEAQPIKGSIEEMIRDQFSDLPEQYHESLLPDSQYVYEAGSTPNCPTGTRGRIAVMEILTMNDQIENIILDQPTENRLYEQARKDGMVTMKEDAIIKALQGSVPFKEVNSL